MQPVAVGEPLDGADAAAVGLDREHQAGAHRIVVEDDGAGAADAVLAADMGPGLAAVIADGVDKGAPRLDPDRIVAPIDVERDVESVGRRWTGDGGPRNGVRASAAHFPLSVVCSVVVRRPSSVIGPSAGTRRTWRGCGRPAPCWSVPRWGSCRAAPTACRRR